MGKDKVEKVNPADYKFICTMCGKDAHFGPCASGTACDSTSTKDYYQTSSDVYRDVAIDIAGLVSSKQAAYGDSFGQSHEIISVLYPCGIAPEQFQDALAIIRIIDKLFRIANDKEAFNEDPWKDIMGYALLSVVKQMKNK